MKQPVSRVKKWSAGRKLTKDGVGGGASANARQHWDLCETIARYVQPMAAELELPRHRRGRLTGDGCALDASKQLTATLTKHRRRERRLQARAPPRGLNNRSYAIGAARSPVPSAGQHSEASTGSKGTAVTHRLAAALAKPRAPADPRAIRLNALLHLLTADNLLSEAGGGEGKALALLWAAALLLQMAQDQITQFVARKITILMPCTCIAALWLELSDRHAGDANRQSQLCQGLCSQR